MSNVFQSTALPVEERLAQLEAAVTNLTEERNYLRGKIAARSARAANYKAQLRHMHRNLRLYKLELRALGDELREAYAKLESSVG